MASLTSIVKLDLAIFDLDAIILFVEFLDQIGRGLNIADPETTGSALRLPAFAAKPIAEVHVMASASAIRCFRIPIILSFGLSSRHLADCPPPQAIGHSCQVGSTTKSPPRACFKWLSAWT